MEELGIDVTVVNAYSEEIPSGSVMLQSRPAGEMLRKEAQITLTVRLGSQWYTLEDMTGVQMEDAIAALEEDGVHAVNVSYTQSDLPVGTVISQDIQPGWVSRDAAVTLKISGRSVEVPSLTGLTLEGARAVIEAEGLKLGNIGEGESADAKSGTVIAQSVAANSQVLAGTTVDLTINQSQPAMYYPASKLSVVVPLNGTQVRVQIRLANGDTQDVYQGILNTGTYRVALSCAEPGTHAVDITMDGVLMDEQNITFE